MHQRPCAARPYAEPRTCAPVPALPCSVVTRPVGSTGCLPRSHRVHQPPNTPREHHVSRTSSADDYLFLGTHGHVIALDKRSGETVWTTSLPKTGYQIVVMLVEDGQILCASAGRAFALDPTSGRILWDNSLPKMGQGIVVLCTVKQSAGQASAAAAQAAGNAAAASSSAAT